VKFINCQTKVWTPDHWTGGQPFLTQKLCQLVIKAEIPARFRWFSKQAQKIAAGKEATYVEQVVQTQLVKHWESQDEPAHLRTIRDRILLAGGRRTGRLLGLYQQVLQHRLSPSSEESQPPHTEGLEEASTPVEIGIRGVSIDDSVEQMELRLSGLVVQREGQLLPYNRIYPLVFNQSWVEKALATLRPYAESLSAWIASDSTDESRLLQGQALQEALSWAEGKSLDNEDYRFLQASERLEHQTVESTLKAKMQKRANRILAVFLSVAIGLAIWGYLAQQQAWENATRAEQQKKPAEQQKALALEAINALTYQLVDELVQLPRTTKIVTRILASNTALLDRIYALDPNTTEARREKGSNLSRLGDAWLLLGNTEKALQAYQQSLDIFQQLAGADPNNAQAQRDLSVSYDNLGDVQQQLGNTEQALAAYQQCHEMSQQLAGADPNNAQAQRDLSISYKLGQVQEALHKPTAALSLYQKALAIAEVLAAQDTHNQQAQNDLAYLRDLVEQSESKL